MNCQHGRERPASVVFAGGVCECCGNGSFSRFCSTCIPERDATCILERDPDWILSHSGNVRSDECPVIGCSDGRTVIAALTFSSSVKRTVSACECHIDMLVARAVTRVTKMQGGQEAVLDLVDRERRCIN